MKSLPHLQVALFLCWGCTMKQEKSEYEMVQLEAGLFSMGADGEEQDEKPVHSVKLSYSFYLGKTEVTQRLWEELMGNNPSSSNECDRNCPVDMVSWFDAIRFANALSQRDGFDTCYEIDGSSVTWSGLTCKGYRLPTEAEWEYAARSQGEAIAYPWGGGYVSCDYAVMNQSGMGCGSQGPQVVCSKPSGNTKQGICDMSGNLYEWVWDWYGVYGLEEELDPTGPKEGFGRGVRGGSWFNSERGLRTTDRSDLHPMRRNGGTGIRLAKSAEM